MDNFHEEDKDTVYMDLEDAKQRDQQPSSVTDGNPEKPGGSFKDGFISGFSKKTGGKPKKKRSFKKRYVVLLIILLLFIISGAITYYKVHPIYVETEKKIYAITSDMDNGTFRRSGNTYVYDKDKKEIGKIGNENYHYVKSSNISDYIKNGYIAQEDKHFATHHGIDYGGVLRAAIKYVLNHGHITQGGSTITQQIIKNNLLTADRTFERKFTEMLAARELEKQYSKAQIMEFYCNSNYYGNGCYGVEGAAEYYFGKSASEVTLAEAAIIVGTSNRPNDYNPEASYEKATMKKQQVLKHMLEQDYITEDQYKAAMEEQPQVVKQTDKTDNDNYMVSYALHCATLEVMKENGFPFQYYFDSNDAYKNYVAKYKDAYKSTSESVRNGGYKLYTSFDQDLQNKLQKYVKEGLSGKLEGAAVCVDNSSQMVVAMVGGKDDDDQYNRGFLMTRSPGSSIKPLLDYGPAINSGVTSPGQAMHDGKVDYNGYSPSNAGGAYYGNVTVREALARSLNTVAVQLFYNTGHKKALKYLADLKFSSLCYADTQMLSPALGGFTYGVKVVDMAKGYAAIANRGAYSDRNCLTLLKKEDGSVVYKAPEKTTEVYNEDTAYMLTDMMQGTFREKYGTAHDLMSDKQFYAGKTGTTNENKDAWFCGFSKYYTTAIWVGRDKPTAVEGLKGASYPAKIWMNYMEDIHANLPKADFPYPDSVYLQDAGGNQQPIVPSQDQWASRPKGFDYMSGVLADELEANLEKQRLKDEKDAAEKAVSEFEDFQIKNTSDAKQLDNKYNQVLDKINAIEDPSERSDYTNRAAYKYGLLAGDVKSKWDKAIKAEEEAEAEKKKIENKEKAADSEDDAMKALRDKKAEVVEWYIDALNNRMMYTASVASLISDAQSALADFEGYKGYNDLSNRLNQAIKRARNLPTEEEIRQQTNQIQMPNQSQYQQSTPSTPSTP